jgi:D-amino-acid dehydrogenase
MGGLWMNDTHSVTDPAALARAYFRLFLQSGGEFRQQAARALRRAGDGWRLEIDGDPIDAEQVIVALGPWSNDLLAPLGCTLPFVQERGYHMMFEPRQGSRLHRSVVDPEAGFVLTPMVHGIRATTGSNLAARERAPNPVQLERLLPLIRRTFPIAGALLEKPWMGRRTSTTDSLPHIGPLKELPGLHVASGHCHLGLTLAPVTGELIADSVAGRNNPLARPFSPHRR